MKLDAISPLDTSSLKGKKFAVIGINLAATQIVKAAAGFDEAMSAVGAKSQKFDGKGSPDVIAQAFQSAIAQHLDGILTVGFDPAIVKSSVAAAKAAKIPVLDQNTGEPQGPLLDGVVAHVSVDAKHEGALQADYALAKSDCKLHAATFYTSSSLITADIAAGAADEVKKLCPTDCSFEQVNVNAATFAATMPGQVQTTLQRSPNINYLFSSSDFFVPYVAQGVKAVGRKVPIVGGGGDGLAAAVAGNGQVADVLWPPASLVGYYSADAMMRALVGTPKNQELPLRSVDSSNWGSSADDSVQFPDLVGFQAAFKKAWGV